MTITGSCHCGKTTFRIEGDSDKTYALHLIVLFQAWRASRVLPTCSVSRDDSAHQRCALSLECNPRGTSLLSELRMRHFLRQPSL